MQPAINCVAADRTNDRHVEDIRTERKNAPVAESQALNDQHGADDKDRRAGSEEDAAKNCADKMARSSAGDGEIKHLRREYERRRKSHEGNARAGNSIRAFRAASAIPATERMPDDIATFGSRNPSGICMAAPESTARPADPKQQAPRRFCSQIVVYRRQAPRDHFLKITSGRCLIIQ